MRANKTYNQDQLIEGFREAYETAFTQLFRELYPSMTGYALRITGNQGIAEEIAELSLFKAWERRENFEMYKVLCSWLYTTVRNASIEWLRGEERKVRAERENELLNGDADPTILEDIIRAEVIREVFIGLEQLPPQCQKIVRMFYLDGKSLQQIADELHLSIHTIKAQKAKGIHVLRRILPLLSLYLNWIDQK